MQKRYNKTTKSHLVRELASLRKGSGIAPHKLQSAHALREIVARHTNSHPNGLTNHQVYDFLLHTLDTLPDTPAVRALLNAYNLKNEQAKLGERRAIFATKEARHADTIERYENTAITELASLLMQPSPDTAIAKPTPASLAYLQHLEKQAGVIRKTTTMGLESLLSLGGHGEELTTYLERSRQPYLDAAVEVKFLPSRHRDNHYRYRLTYLFRGARETFRVALVTSTTDGEQLMQTALIDEFIKLNEAVPREMRAIINTSKFILRSAQPDTQRLLRFKELSPTETERLLNSSGITLEAECRLFEIAIPLKWQTPDTYYEYQSVFNLQMNERYAYWYSPGLMYIKKITFDFSAFPSADTWQFFPQPFLGHLPGRVPSENEHIIIYKPNSWIMPGHGISLTWQPRH